MILNKDCFFYKKSDFINRLPDISEESICYIADTQQIYVQGRYFECNVTRDIVESLIKSKGYLTAADLPTLTGGAASLPGEYVTGVTVDGYDVNVQKGKLSEIVVGTASKLETPRNISLSGDVSGSISFDGSKDIVIDTTVLDDSHSHSNYVTTNTTQNVTGLKTFARDAASVLYVENTAATSTSKYSAIVFQRAGSNIGILAADVDTNYLYRANPAFSTVYTMLDTGNYTNYTYPTTVAKISDLHSSWDSILKTSGVRSRGMTYNGVNYPCYTAAANTSDITWYAPTTAGTSGYVLQSTGGAPKWTSRATLQHELLTAGQGCTAIPANADLNDYTTTGVYYCTYNATVETWSNSPTGNACSLTVLTAAGVIQILREYGYSSSAREFTRRYYDGTWTSWVQTPRMSDLTWSNISGRPTFSYRNGTLTITA